MRKTTMRKRDKKHLGGRILFLAMMGLMICLSGGCMGEKDTKADVPLTETAEQAVMSVHFLDVGQGDSALIEVGGHAMLIDAGERDRGPDVVSYLMDCKITKLDYVIGTHPHSDHIGGVEDVISAFDVDQVMIPNVEHTTRTFEYALDAIEKKGLKVTVPTVGDKYQLGDASFQILAPNEDYKENLNDWSIGLKITYGSSSFVFCGDAEKEAEYDICKNGLDIRGDVLKLSHHGSHTSSTGRFMDAVNPKYAVISCGRDNDYGYPHKETKAMLKNRGIETYRTDEQGTIIAQSDGTDITWHTLGIAEKQENPDKADYILNINGKKFHLPSCKGVSDMKEHNRKEYCGDRADLVAMGYEPCQSCKP